MNLRASCPACASGDLRPFYEVKGVPAHNSLVFRTREEARAFPKGDLAITLCERCGFIFNASFDPSLLAYSPAYEDQQSFSGTFNKFARELAAELIERYGLREKSIVEIGCGKGDFLALLCTLEENRGIGIDPTALEERLQGEAARRVRFLQEFYSPAHASLDVDFLCCRHTLEHIPEVGEFMGAVRGSLEGKDIGVFFELPDVKRVLDEVAYWDIYYEHCSYFDTGSLARLFRRNDFEVADVRLGYDDQYLLLNARPGRKTGGPVPGENSVEQTRAGVDEFTRAVKAITGAWRAYFDVAERDCRRVAIWGSGSKCVAFLTTLAFDPGENVVVVDINPHRHGKFIPGSAMEIRSPESLREHGPDDVIVMNEIYRDEIAEQLQRMGVPARVITADGTMRTAV